MRSRAATQSTANRCDSGHKQAKLEMLNWSVRAIKFEQVECPAADQSADRRFFASRFHWSAASSS
eukprot:COSAG06_NODE_49443_length_325_cov_0.911504_1_plen_64_part_10